MSEEVTAFEIREELDVPAFSELEVEVEDLHRKTALEKRMGKEGSPDRR